MAPALSALACQQSLLFLLFPDMQENVSVDDRVAICSEYQGTPEMGARVMAYRMTSKSSLRVLGGAANGKMNCPSLTL